MLAAGAAAVVNAARTTIIENGRMRWPFAAVRAIALNSPLARTLCLVHLGTMSLSVGARQQRCGHMRLTSVRHDVQMFDIGSSLMGALVDARRKLAAGASATARAQTDLGNDSGDGAMAQIAERAIFSEALLAATHARLEEIKTAAK